MQDQDLRAHCLVQRRSLAYLTTRDQCQFIMFCVRHICFSRTLHEKGVYLLNEEDIIKAGPDLLCLAQIVRRAVHVCAAVFLRYGHAKYCLRCTCRWSTRRLTGQMGSVATFHMRELINSALWLRLWLRDLFKYGVLQRMEGELTGTQA